MEVDKDIFYKVSLRLFLRRKNDIVISDIESTIVGVGLSDVMFLRIS